RGGARPPRRSQPRTRRAPTGGPPAAPSPRCMAAAARRATANASVWPFASSTKWTLTSPTPSATTPTHATPRRVDRPHTGRGHDLLRLGRGACPRARYRGPAQRVYAPALQAGPHARPPVPAPAGALHGDERGPDPGELARLPRRRFRRHAGTRGASHADSRGLRGLRPG